MRIFSRMGLSTLSFFLFLGAFPAYSGRFLIHLEFFLFTPPDSRAARGLLANGPATLCPLVNFVILGYSQAFHLEFRRRRFLWSTPSLV